MPVRFVTLRRDAPRPGDALSAANVVLHLRNLRMKIYPQMDADLTQIKLEDDNGGDACWSEP